MVLLSFFLVFCQFQPGVAAKSVVYKKKHVSDPVLKTIMKKYSSHPSIPHQRKYE